MVNSGVLNCVCEGDFPGNDAVWVELSVPLIGSAVMC